MKGFKILEVHRGGAGRLVGTGLGGVTIVGVILQGNGEGGGGGGERAGGWTVIKARAMPGCPASYL